MEYTNDMVFNVKYKKDKSKRKKQRKIVTTKVIYTILGTIALLTILDLYLLSNFFNILGM